MPWFDRLGLRINDNGVAATNRKKHKNKTFLLRFMRTLAAVVCIGRHSPRQVLNPFIISSSTFFLSDPAIIGYSLT
jgi:hypothetical protein